jgi:hypothetical protein
MTFLSAVAHGHERRLLEHEAQVAARQRSGLVGRRPVDRARGRRAEARDHAQHRRLAAARWTEQADELVRADRGVEAVDRERAVREALRDVAQDDQRAHAWRFGPDLCACHAVQPWAHPRMPTRWLTKRRL